MRFKVTWSAWLSFFFFVAATSFDATVDRARAKERERGSTPWTKYHYNQRGVKWCALGIFSGSFMESQA
jgi:hypothetical protein